ncbi:unnamed protein product [Albugo candida]|uniref:Uncharacterized protein n=1 Tax=Albugo candida TaxID=65357 RepID=A0A024GTJ0_9STRA|nr:unnamed protein product [Albugo candida]|eukprot:CCI50114.1 unnamed protein product [Albugo candida]
MDSDTVWLRLELFELGLLHVPIKSTSITTLCAVTRALDCISGCQNDDQDVNMTPESEEYKNDNAQSQAINFNTWKSVVKEHLEWPEENYTAFWLLLVYFHRNIPTWDETEKVILTEERCLSVEVVPTHRITIFLFVQASRFHASKTKATLDSFNAKWCREFPTAGTEKASIIQSPSGGASPVLLSPHTKAMQDRATLDDYYLSFVGNNLETLFQLLFPQLESTPESEKHIHSNQVDQLGFLVSFGIEKDEPLSTVYKLWRVDTHGNKFETANRICEFLKRSLGLSTDLYPALGFSLVENVSLHIGAQNDHVTSTGNFAKPAIELQKPHDFLVITIPIIATVLKLEFPFPLPEKFREALSKQAEEIENFRNMICDEEFDAATKRLLEQVIQNRFKEWLTVTGNARQILDLVHIEKTRK